MSAFASQRDPYWAPQPISQDLTGPIPGADQAIIIFGGKEYLVSNKNENATTLAKQFSAQFDSYCTRVDAIFTTVNMKIDMGDTLTAPEWMELLRIIKLLLQDRCEMRKRIAMYIADNSKCLYTAPYDGTEREFHSIDDLAIDMRSASTGIFKTGARLIMRLDPDDVLAPVGAERL